MAYEAEHGIPEMQLYKRSKCPAQGIKFYVRLQGVHLQVSCRQQLRIEYDVLAIVKAPVFREDPLLRFEGFVDLRAGKWSQYGHLYRIYLMLYGEL